MFYNKPTYLLVWSRDKSASLSRAGKMDELTTTTSRKSQQIKTRTIVIAITIGIVLVIFGGLVFPLSFQAIMDAVLDEVS